MNIIEFAENICNFHLSDWQKEYILNAYEAIKNNKQLFYIPPCGNSRFSFTLLQLIAITDKESFDRIMEVVKND